MKNRAAKAGMEKSTAKESMEIVHAKECTENKPRERMNRKTRVEEHRNKTLKKRRRENPCETSHHFFSKNPMEKTPIK